MSKQEKQKDAGKDSATLFSIVDQLVYQIDRTKKLVVAMVITVIVSIPVTWHVSPLVPGTTFRLAGVATIVLGVVVFLTIGVRQLLLLSDWTRRYKAYKEQQRRIDESLDFEDHGEGSGNSGT